MLLNSFLRRHTGSMNTDGRLRGVNLGGWLVVEKWLTESLFVGTEAHDEYGLMKTTGAKAKIKRHRRTFITEKDFAWLKTNGVNAVRIPVGYWLFESQDGHVSAIEYLDRAMGWAEKHEIKVLIDVHAARGSQNGGDHSGRSGKAEWFNRSDYQEETIVLLCQIAERYSESSALWGIELLNEPATRGNYWKLLKFYRRAYRELRGVARPGTRIVFHDGFRPLLFAGALWGRKTHPVVMDVHWYAFTLGRYDSLTEYEHRSKRARRVSLRWLQLWQPVIVGEWSTVLPQRLFDDVPKSEHNELLGRNVAAQRAAYEAALGDFYWNYKAEGRGMWHFRSLVEDGIISIDP